MDDLRARARHGAALEDLAGPALCLLDRPGTAARNVVFDDDVRVMAARVAGGTVVHGGRAAGPDRMRGTRLLAALLLSLSGEGVHMICPDEEAAEAEAAAARAVYGPLGVVAATVRSGMDAAGRRSAYAADVTFGALSRFGPDALADARVMDRAARVGRGTPAAVVSDPGQVMIAFNRRITLLEKDVTPAGELRRIAGFAAGLREGADVTVDAESAVPRLTPRGRERLHDAYGVVVPVSTAALLLEKRAVEAVLARRSRRGEEYELAGGEVLRLPSGTLPDGLGFTGGLRQAIEVREGVAVSDTDWPVAVGSVPAHFRGYRVVGGTSQAELLFTAELEELFGLRVWDRRTEGEREAERVHAADLGRYLELNRKLARWDAVGCRHRAGFGDLRESLWEPSGTALAVRSLTGDAVPADADTDALRAGLRSVLDQALVHYNVAEGYGRGAHWPDGLPAYERSLTEIRDSLWHDVRGAVARWLRKGPSAGA
ncbi:MULTISPECIES: hypothetical protein [unclassified Streptomyces]|uniref:hypothetical protein n=1 Tax=unclassified Streptomyces TaxID=2593676 RepID=UPI002E2B2AA3|nr:hypothetical protein [Streptomyces sp. NBC_00223]